MYIHIYTHMYNDVAVYAIPLRALPLPRDGEGGARNVITIITMITIITTIITMITIITTIITIITITTTSFTIITITTTLRALCARSLRRGLCGRKGGVYYTYFRYLLCILTHRYIHIITYSCITFTCCARPHSRTDRSRCST